MQIDELDLSRLQISDNHQERLIYDLYNLLKVKGGIYTFTYFHGPDGSINFHKLRFKTNGHIKEIMRNISLHHSILIEMFGKRNVEIEQRGVLHIQSPLTDLETVLRHLIARENFCLQNMSCQIN